jgi:hypothetical protein
LYLVEWWTYGTGSLCVHQSTLQHYSSKCCQTASPPNEYTDNNFRRRRQPILYESTLEPSLGAWKTLDTRPNQNRPFQKRLIIATYCLHHPRTNQMYVTTKSWITDSIVIYYI